MYQNNEKTNMETRDDVSVYRTPPGQKLTEKFPVLTSVSYTHLTLPTNREV